MDITLIVKIVLMVLAAIYTYILVPFIKAKTTDTELESLKKFVRAGVRAAEMIYNEDGMGAKKKAYVLEYLKELGYSIDVNEIDAIIEGAVYELKKEFE